MTGAQYIAAFLAGVGARRVFLLNGGACAFMVDAVARHPSLAYTCFQHEQSAAMAADAVWRTDRSVGVAMATSGPGATNLITGIACSFFDSIPALHITGQVNQAESRALHGARVRQAGFQETDIVQMVAPVTKHAVKVTSGEGLRRELVRAFELATTGRMGPVLIDVPMDVQQAEIEGDLLLPRPPVVPDADASVVAALNRTLAAARRPVVLWGGGVGLADVGDELADWLDRTGVPFVASWAGLSGFDHAHPAYVGQIGVYGNRGANFVLQNADTVLVLGSRLDNRQRSGNAATFARDATIHVVDVDGEELKKYRDGRYRVSNVDLRQLPSVLDRLAPPPVDADWRDYVSLMKQRYFGRETSSSAKRLNTLSPYDVVRTIRDCLEPDAVVAGDTGATVCWLHQAFSVARHTLFTAGGHSPMGYALPAAIGAKLTQPKRQVVAVVGDGGFQLNLQELQTLKHEALGIAIVVMNNAGYGIIRQFQDSYLGGRHDASDKGYSAPDFGRIAAAYGLRYARIERLEQITPALFAGESTIVDVVLGEDTLIEPKLEMGRPINDQFPYLGDEEYGEGNRFVAYRRPERQAG